MNKWLTHYGDTVPTHLHRCHTPELKCDSLGHPAPVGVWAGVTARADALTVLYHTLVYGAVLAVDVGAKAKRESATAVSTNEDILRSRTR